MSLDCLADADKLLRLDIELQYWGRPVVIHRYNRAAADLMYHQ